LIPFSPNKKKRKIHDTCSNEIKENRKIITIKITTVERLHTRAAPWGGLGNLDFCLSFDASTRLKKKKDQYRKGE
jgi:hypothetical protein